MTTLADLPFGRLTAAAVVETLSDGLAGPTGVAEIGRTAWVSEGQLPYLLKQKTGGPKLPFDLRAVPLPAH